jgi:hypothetical protein
VLLTGQVNHAKRRHCAFRGRYSSKALQSAALTEALASGHAGAGSYADTCHAAGAVPLRRRAISVDTTSGSVSVLHTVVVAGAAGSSGGGTAVVTSLKSLVGKWAWWWCAARGDHRSASSHHCEVSLSSHVVPAAFHAEPAESRPPSLAAGSIAGVRDVREVAHLAAVRKRMYPRTFFSAAPSSSSSKTPSCRQTPRAQAASRAAPRRAPSRSRRAPR